MNRAKVETQHGGGEIGRKAVQDNIDIGKYLERKITNKLDDGRTVTVEEVCVNEAKMTEVVMEKIKEKKSSGGKATESDFKAILTDKYQSLAINDISGASSSRVMKRPAAPMAIEDGSVEVASCDKLGLSDAHELGPKK